MADLLHEQKVLILDFGSQYTQNIARKVRECQVYCEIQPCTMTLKAISQTKGNYFIRWSGECSRFRLSHMRFKIVWTGNSRFGYLLWNAINHSPVGRQSQPFGPT